jgi:hypothetical protein
MRPGPLTVLGIVDHAVEAARRHPRFVLCTIVAGSLPLALGAAAGVHFIRTRNLNVMEVGLGAGFLALLTIPRALGWGAGVIGLQGFLDDAPARPSDAWRRAFARAPHLFVTHARPLMWILFAVLVCLGPLALAGLSSNPGSFFASAALTLAACTIGAFVAVFATTFVSRRVLALPIAATGTLDAGASIRRSLELVRGQTIRAVSLQTYLAVLQIIVWLTLVQSIPWGLEFAEILTGYSFVELKGILTYKDASYLAFQGAVSFLIMDPVRCLCLGYFHQDGETRRSGADLGANLEKFMANPDAVLEAEEAR